MIIYEDGTENNLSLVLKAIRKSCCTLRRLAVILRLILHKIILFAISRRVTPFGYAGKYVKFNKIYQFLLFHKMQRKNFLFSMHRNILLISFSTSPHNGKSLVKSEYPSGVKSLLNPFFKIDCVLFYAGGKIHVISFFERGEKFCCFSAAPV